MKYLWSTYYLALYFDQQAGGQNKQQQQELNHQHTQQVFVDKHETLLWPLVLNPYLQDDNRTEQQEDDEVPHARDQQESNETRLAGTIKRRRHALCKSLKSTNPNLDPVPKAYGAIERDYFNRLAIHRHVHWTRVLHSPAIDEAEHVEVEIQHARQTADDLFDFYDPRRYTDEDFLVWASSGRVLHVDDVHAPFAIVKRPAFVNVKAAFGEKLEKLKLVPAQQGLLAHVGTSYNNTYDRDKMKMNPDGRDQKMNNEVRSFWLEHYNFGSFDNDIVNTRHEDSSGSTRTTSEERKMRITTSKMDHTPRRWEYLLRPLSPSLAHKFVGFLSFLDQYGCELLRGATVFELAAGSAFFSLLVWLRCGIQQHDRNYSVHPQHPHAGGRAGGRNKKRGRGIERVLVFDPDPKYAVVQKEIQDFITPGAVVVQKKTTARQEEDEKPEKTHMRNDKSRFEIIPAQDDIFNSQDIFSSSTPPFLQKLDADFGMFFAGWQWVFFCSNIISLDESESSTSGPSAPSLKSSSGTADSVGSPPSTSRGRVLERAVDELQKLGKRGIFVEWIDVPVEVQRERERMSRLQAEVDHDLYTTQQQQQQNPEKSSDSEEQSRTESTASILVTTVKRFLERLEGFSEVSASFFENENVSGNDRLSSSSSKKSWNKIHALLEEIYDEERFQNFLFKYFETIQIVPYYSLDTRRLYVAHTRRTT